MNILKEKIINNIFKKDSKKSIENLIVFVIILIATIIFINYIWKDDNKNEKKANQSISTFSETYNNENDVNQLNNSLETKLENILINLEGVEDAKVLITYSETNKVIPMYNENIEQSVTKEEDNRGRC